MIAEVVVDSALQAHQLHQYLQRLPGILWARSVDEDGVPLGCRFRIDATPEQWESINQWVEKVKQ